MQIAKNPTAWDFQKAPPKFKKAPPNFRGCMPLQSNSHRASWNGACQNLPTTEKKRMETPLSAQKSVTLRHQIR
ncbi:MAG: hypothetical protein IJ892_00190 [Prevotella sp.]|nr:hypothetical protein [Prevotella sp.]